MISYQKVGGLHWLSIGRLRIAWCMKRQNTTKLQPVTKWNLERPTLPKVNLDPNYRAYWSHRPQGNNILDW